MPAGGLNQFPGSLLIMKLVLRLLAQHMPKDVAFVRMTKLLPDEIGHWENVNEKKLEYAWLKSRMRSSRETRNVQLKLTNAIASIVVGGNPLFREEVEELWIECQDNTTEIFGRVYLFASKEYPRLHKIGMTIQSVEARLSQLRYDKKIELEIVLVIETGSLKKTKFVEQVALTRCAAKSDQPEGAIWGREYFMIDRHEAIGALMYADAVKELKDKDADTAV